MLVTQLGCRENRIDKSALAHTGDASVRLAQRLEDILSAGQADVLASIYCAGVLRAPAATRQNRLHRRAPLMQAGRTAVLPAEAHERVKDEPITPHGLALMVHASKRCSFVHWCAQHRMEVHAGTATVIDAAAAARHAWVGAHIFDDVCRASVLFAIRNMSIERRPATCTACRVAAPVKFAIGTLLGDYAKAQVALLGSI
mmetsp:Transcript_40315/g.99957  ORF Transcript_40315/g.99957 Transcript_40315/m.99957 type:complete len:200 (+) Transcript_40315:7437-8036(+)